MNEKMNAAATAAAVSAIAAVAANAVVRARADVEKALARLHRAEQIAEETAALAAATDRETENG